MDDITTKANECLNAINDARKKAGGQVNRSVLELAEKFVLRINQGDLEAKHELKGLFMYAPEVSDPTTDIWYMEVNIGHGTKTLQYYINKLIQSVEKKLYPEEN